MIASRSQLAVKLSKLSGFINPKLRLRQYATPPVIASDLLWSAYMNGDITGLDVVDLGAGTGILSLGAALLGGRVTAYEIDRDAINIAVSNARRLGVKLAIIEEDVMNVNDPCDTVIMNPPFMVKNGVNDRMFLEKAFSLASTVYSIHTSQTRKWVNGFASNNGFTPILLSTHKFPLPLLFKHHTKLKGEQIVDLWVFKR